MFCHNDEQKQLVEQIINEMTEQQTWPEPIVTQVVPATTFFPAEAYHQDYFNNNPDNRYCQLVVSPKLAKFKQTFANKLKAE